jgi:anti-sigma-K factor RskA
MTHRVEEQELLRRIAALPREIQPENDPWTAISARIAEPRQSDRHQRGWRGWMLQAAAASVALALILGVVFGPRLTNPPPAATGHTVASGQGVAA